MRRWILGALVSLVAAAQAESQPRAAVVADRAALRVESGGNELVALRDAPVAYARLTGLAVDIARPAEPGAGPIRVARAWPRQLIDTRDGWLWLVEVLLSREVTVVLEVRAPASWPVESVSVTADHVP